MHTPQVFLCVCLLAGLCMNRWCLEELVRRDPNNFIILQQKILKKAKEVDISKTRPSCPWLSLKPKKSDRTSSCHHRCCSSVGMNSWFPSPSCSLLLCYEWVLDTVTNCGTRSTSIIIPILATSGASCGCRCGRAAGGLPIVPLFPDLARALLLCQ